MRKVLDACICVGAAEGRVKDGDIQCAYHGWQYNSRGQCTRIPQVPSFATAPCPTPETKTAGEFLLPCEVDTENAFKVPMVGLWTS